MAHKFNKSDLEKAGKFIAILAAAGLAVVNELSNQKRDAEYKEFKKVYETLKGKES